MQPLISSAWNRTQQAFRPSTRSAHYTHFKTYLSFTGYMKVAPHLTVATVLAFMEYLTQNAISPKVLQNYISSIRTVAKSYGWDTSALSHYSVSHLLRSLRINSTFSPTVRGIFDLHTLELISKSCDLLDDLKLYRAVYLLAFFAFLRMSNVAPHSRREFDPNIHLLRQDISFAFPGAKILLKWTKTLQDHKAHHIVHVPKLQNTWLCPVFALQNLLLSRPLQPKDPLFVTLASPHTVIIDTHIRDKLKWILAKIGLSPHGLGFHAFRRSGATLAFDNGVALEDIMAHGLWRSSAVWTYLKASLRAPSVIPKAFASVIPPSFP